MDQSNQNQNQNQGQKQQEQKKSNNNQQSDKQNVDAQAWKLKQEQKKKLSEAESNQQNLTEEQQKILEIKRKKKENEERKKAESKKWKENNSQKKDIADNKDDIANQKKNQQSQAQSQQQQQAQNSEKNQNHQKVQQQKQLEIKDTTKLVKTSLEYISSDPQIPEVSSSKEEEDELHEMSSSNKNSNSSFNGNKQLRFEKENIKKQDQDDTSDKDESEHSSSQNSIVQIKLKQLEEKQKEQSSLSSIDLQQQQDTTEKKKMSLIPLNQDFESQTNKKQIPLIKFNKNSSNEEEDDGQGNSELKKLQEQQKRIQDEQIKSSNIFKKRAQNRSTNNLQSLDTHQKPVNFNFPEKSPSQPQLGIRSCLKKNVTFNDDQIERTNSQGQSPVKRSPNVSQHSKNIRRDNRSQSQLIEHLPKFQEKKHADICIKCSNNDNSEEVVKDIHPAIMEIGLKFNNDVIIGSNDRCMAFLEAMKKVIMDFQVEANQDFARAFDQEVEKILEEIEEYRSVTEGMRTAYKFCKQLIAKLFLVKRSVDACKNWLCEQITNFIKQKIISADDFIIKYGLDLIKNGDIIMVYARSMVIEKLLIKSYQQGKRFTIIVVDNPPFFEGRKLLKNLQEERLECIYTLLSHVPYLIKKVSKIFIGASAMLTNGGLISRVGTALLACLAHEYRRPFQVFCETYKFSEKSYLDSLSVNELAKNFLEEDEEQNQNNNNGIYGVTMSQEGEISKSAEKQKKKQQKQNQINQIKIESESEQSQQEKQFIVNDQNLRPINLRYDLTPSEYINMVVTESGILPPTSVPHILREFSRNNYIGKIELPPETEEKN